MFDLSTASINVRKAAALQGCRSGKWEPINSGYDATVDSDGDTQIVCQIHNRNGVYVITQRDINESSQYTWKEII